MSPIGIEWIPCLRKGIIVLLAGTARKFILLDRDGVINKAVRGGYVTSIAMLHLIPGAARAIATLNRHGYQVLVVSNQQCVGKGLLRAEELEKISAALRDMIRRESGGVIADYFYCPHLAAVNCTCRKPRPGLILEAQRRYGIRLSETYFIGDSYSDIETARRAGCRPVFVLSGLDAARYHVKEAFPSEPEFIAADLAEAAALILNAATTHAAQAPRP